MRRASNGASQENASRERLLDEAIGEFASRGFASASTGRIAERAQLNRQLIYYYFGDKQGLYEAALARAFERARGLWVELEGETYVERLARFVRTLAEPEAMQWRRMMFWDALQGVASRDDRVDIDVVTREGWLYGLDQVREAQDQGILDSSLDTEMLTLALTGLAHIPHTFPQVTKGVTGSLPWEDGLVDRYVEFLEAFLGRR